MRKIFALKSVKLVLLVSSIFVSGCRDELASTKRDEPERVSQTTSTKAEQPTATDEVALDELASQSSSSNLFESGQSQTAEWEEGISLDSNKSERPNLDEILTLESTELENLGGDVSETEQILK